MAYQIEQNNTALPLRFLMVLAADHITGATGKTPTVTIAKTNGTFATPSGTVSAVGNGWYQVSPNASDASTLGPLTLHATAPGCDPADEEYLVVNYNPQITAAQGTPSTTTIAVSQLITSALRRMRVIGAGEDATDWQVADGLLTLNELIDSLGVEPLTMYSIVRTTWTITSTKGTPTNPYTVGPSGDINIARPIFISRIAYQDTSVSPTQEYPLWMLTDQAYQTIPQKTLTSTLPNSVYYQPTYPTGSLYFWMVPSQSNLQGVIYAQTAIPKFGAVTDLVALPPGYQRMFRDQLVLELWPNYKSEPIDPAFVAMARESKAFVKAANLRPTDLSLDPAILTHGGWYDITTDQTR